jgi:hypothetical protein
VNKLYILSLCVFLVFTLVVTDCRCEDSLFDPDYLTSNSSSFSDVLSNITSEEHLNALSFSAVMGELASDDHLNAISFEAWLQNQNNSSNGTTGGTSANGTNATSEPAEIVLLDEGTDNGVGGSNSSGGYTHTDANFWRAWQTAAESQNKQEIYKGTWEQKTPITLGKEPWSFTYWPMNYCGLSFNRVATIDPAKLTNSQDASQRKNFLSPLEAFDTWCYNTYGKNPYSAAWEAEYHNTGKHGARKIENSKDYAQYWILKTQLVKVGNLPFKITMSDGRTPEARRGTDPLIIQYQVKAGQTTYTVPGQIHSGEQNYFPNTPVEEFHIPMEAASSLSLNGMSGMDVKYKVFEFNEEGYPVKELGDFSWNEINSNPELKKHHRSAQPPSFIRMFRTINVSQNGYGQTISWYYLQYSLKPGLSEYSWWGHCNGWSAASLNTPLPETLPVVKEFSKEISIVRLKKNSPMETIDSSGNSLLNIDDSDYEIIKTTSKTMEIQPSQYFGVATVLWNDSDENVTNREDPFYQALNIRDFEGNRVYENTQGGTDLGNKVLSDIYPHHFFSVLMRHVKERKEGIVCDTNKGSQVWNSPVRAFNYSHTWVPIEGDETTAGYYSLALYVDYVPYGGLTESRNPADYVLKNQWPQKWKGYKAKLFVDKKTNRIYRGEWDAGNIPYLGSVDSNNDHPDFCWIPVGARYSKVMHQNALVSDERAEAFLKLK